MTIREATDADRDGVVALVMRFLESTRYGQLVDHIAPEFIQATFDLALSQGVCLVAEMSTGRLGGFIAGAVVPHMLSGDPFLRELAWWVDPELRHSSVGRRLLSRFEEWGRSNSIHMIEMVAPDGSRVGRYYDRLGYVAVETTYFKRL